jgi:hypothetical protein
MTRYMVMWTQRCQNELAQIWMDSLRREEIAAAANEIDALLVEDADQKGEPASKRSRELAVPPLQVLFTVSEPDRRVTVTRVRLL